MNTGNSLQPAISSVASSCSVVLHSRNLTAPSNLLSSSGALHGLLLNSSIIRSLALSSVEPGGGVSHIHSCGRHTPGGPAEEAGRSSPRFWV